MGGRLGPEPVPPMVLRRGTMEARPGVAVTARRRVAVAKPDCFAVKKEKTLWRTAPC